METLLDLLFERFDRAQAIDILRYETVREQAFAQLAGDLASSGMPAGMLDTSEGENLFVAVLSLRIKFPEAEAREKVQLNIAMREGRR
jgi:hypothetical protein